MKKFDEKHAEPRGGTLLRRAARRRAAVLLAAVLMLSMLFAAGCGKDEPVMDGVGQEVVFFALPIGGYQCAFTDEILPLKLSLLALEGDYAKKGSVLRSAELIAPNGVRYPLMLGGISEIKDAKKYYGYDGYQIEATLQLPAEGLHRFFAMEIRYGENADNVEILPLGGELIYEVIGRSNLVEPIYSAGYTEVGVQADGVYYPYRYNALEGAAMLHKIWIDPLTMVEAPAGESLPLAGSIQLPPLAAVSGAEIPGMVRVICPKLETSGGKGMLYQHGSPVYCGIIEVDKENKDALGALGEVALALRVAFVG